LGINQRSSSQELKKNFHTPAFNIKKIDEEIENIKVINKEFTLGNEKRNKEEYATCKFLI
jgi:hypothetical protein